MLRFYIPFTYWLYTRFKSSSKVLEFLALYIVPSGIVCLSNQNSVAFLIALIAVSCVFEAGFIQNDIYSPSQYRCAILKSNAQFYIGIKKHIRTIIVWRYILAASLILVLYTIQDVYPQRFVIVLLLSACLFSIHSGVHGRWRLLTEGILYTLQCAALPFLFLNDPWHVTFAFILALVVRRVVEAASIPEYHLYQAKELLTNPASFYITYYGALEIAAFVLLAFWRKLATVLLTISSWYLLFTLVSFVFSITEKKANKNW